MLPVQAQEAQALILAGTQRTAQGKDRCRSLGALSGTQERHLMSADGALRGLGR